MPGCTGTSLETRAENFVDDCEVGYWQRGERCGLSLAAAVSCLLVAEVGCRLLKAWTRFRESDDPPLHIIEVDLEILQR